MDNTKNSMWPNGSPAELSGLKLPSDETSQQSSQLNQDLNLPTTYENSQYALSTGMIQSQQPLPKKRSPISNIESNFAVEAFSEIFSLPIGLCVIDPQNRCHVVFPMQFCSCYQIVPHKHYQQPSYYCISFKGRKTPLRIFEKDFNNPKTLTQRLSQHFNVQVKFFKSKKKTADLLHSFFSSKAIRQYVPFYFGWEEKNDGYWEYSLYRGTTHALHSWEEDPGFLIPISDDNFQQYSSTSSAILAAATQTVEMMQTISNCCIRGILWLYMHAAALFSLLREINFRISSGICIYSNDEHVLIALEKLLNWFYDETIQLSEDNFSFLTLLLERKDQPLVIRDATSQPANSKILAQCVQTGRIPSAAKNSNEFFDLSALPFVLSSETSTLNFSSNFLPLEILSEDISANAYQVFANQKGYFQDYLGSMKKLV